MKATVRRGTIEVFGGTWESGLAWLLVSGHAIPCDNAATVRALDACFGDFIVEGHRVDSKAIMGKDIVYSTDAFGILEAFTPTKEWRKMHGAKNTPKIGEELEIEIPEENEQE